MHIYFIIFGNVPNIYPNGSRQHPHNVPKHAMNGTTVQIHTQKQTTKNEQ